MTLKQRTTTQNSLNTFVISNNGQLAIHSSLLVYILLVSDKAHYKFKETVQIQLYRVSESWGWKIVTAQKFLLQYFVHKKMNDGLP